MAKSPSTQRHPAFIPKNPPIIGPSVGPKFTVRFYLPENLPVNGQ
jgi:hypothetical protein